MILTLHKLKARMRACVHACVRARFGNCKIVHLLLIINVSSPIN